MTLHEALKALNKAAYDAIRAGRDTTMHPDLDRQFLREIAWATDKLVDENAPTVEAPAAEMPDIPWSCGDEGTY